MRLTANYAYVCFCQIIPPGRITYEVLPSYRITRHGCEVGVRFVGYISLR